MSDYKVKGIQACLPIGTIIYWAGTDTNDLPSDWKVCNGTSLLNTSYPDLYARIGTNYGSTSQWTFNIPNLTGKRLRGANDFNSAHTTGNVGAATITLGNSNLPSHNHNGTNWNHWHTTNNSTRFHDAGGTGNLRYVTVGNSGINDSDYQMRWGLGGSGNGNSDNTPSGTNSISLDPPYINLYAIIKVL